MHQSWAKLPLDARCRFTETLLIMTRREKVALLRTKRTMVDTVFCSASQPIYRHGLCTSVHAALSAPEISQER